MLDSATITRQLLTLGVTPGSALMVHASLRAVGPVEGGAAGVLAAIDAALGPKGTVLMLLGADADDPFEADHTPVDTEDMGILAEVFRQSGAQVSDHPVSRYGAMGPLANTLLRDAPLHHYHGPGSPLERLVTARGAVLRLGADPDTLTLTHLAEYQACLPNKRSARRRYLRADTGEVWIDSLDDDDGVIEGNDGAYFAQVLADYLSEGLAKTGPVGECTAELIDAAAFVRYAKRWLERRFA